MVVPPWDYYKWHSNWPADIKSDLHSHLPSGHLAERDNEISEMKQSLNGFFLYYAVRCSFVSLCLCASILSVSSTMSLLD